MPDFRRQVERQRVSATNDGSRETSWNHDALVVLCHGTEPGTATVQHVTAAREGTDLRVEITLSAPVKPTVETAANPDRILLDFPGTTCNREREEYFSQYEWSAPGAHCPAQHNSVSSLASFSISIRLIPTRLQLTGTNHSDGGALRSRAAVTWSTRSRHIGQPDWCFPAASRQCSCN